LLLAEPPQTGPETEKRFPSLKVPAGFKATLFACVPLIEYPSSIALGPRANTLFVAADYMTGLGTTDIIRRDEIRLVEDTDGDGYADEAPVWADGFNSIQGLTYHDGTVFVMHAPYLTALRDTDGDGVADERKNLFKGFGLGPEDDKVRLHNANGIVAGHDGWLYLALGDRGCDVVRPEGDLLILNGGGILRCRPDGRDLHVFSTGLRNIYDVALDEDLNVFTRDNENDGGNYKIRVIRSFFGADHGYPYLYDERPAEALAPLADLGLGSSAGGVYYKETQFPAEYRGLYFCEWGRAVMRYVPQRGGFKPVSEIEFAAGAENDPYGFKPTDLVVDRDGSLLIADWADGQRPKRGRARVYRVQYVGRALLPDQKAANTEPQGRAGVPILRLDDWIERLNSESYYERLEAQLAIEKLGRDDPAGVVESLRKSRTLNERASVHFVWILAHLQGAQATDELFKMAQLGGSMVGDSTFARLRTQAIRALADLHDPVLVEHRLDAGASDAMIAKRLSGLVHWRTPGATFDVLVALGRLRWAQAPLWMSQNLEWVTPEFEHAAQQTLRRCGDGFAVLRLLDGREQNLPSRFKPKTIGQPDPPTTPGVPLRTVALRALADQANTRIVDGLEARLRLEPNASRRREYADLLSRVHRKPSTQWVYWGFRPAPRPANTVAWERTEFIEQALDRRLVDPDESVRRFVLERMQREKIPTRLATLGLALRTTEDQGEQALILTSLRDQPAEARREILRSFLTDREQFAPLRMNALRLWCEGLGADRASRLLDLASSLRNDRVLAELLRELVPRTNEVNPEPALSPEVKTLLLGATSDEVSHVRATAIEILATRRVPEAAEIVPQLLNDKWPDVRLAAVVAAGKLEVRNALPRLLASARHDADDSEIRRASLDALRQLREPRVVPLAVAALADRTTQLSALKCLAEFGGPDQAADVTKVALRNSSSEVLNLAIQMLSSWSRRSELTAERQTELDLSVRELQGASGFLTAWDVVGPLPANAASAIVEVLRDDSRSVKDADTGTAQWTHLFGVGPESRLRTGEKINGEWVAFAEFVVSDPATAQFLLSSNAPLRVWLNGKLALTRVESRRFQPDSDRCEAELVKGTNRLVIQLGNVPDAPVEFHGRFRRKSSKAEHERLVEAALTRPGNVERGRKVFLTVEKSQCLKCHRLNDQGEKIGPELTGIGSRFSRVHIVESLLEPSRTIAAGFQAQTVELADGRVLTGLKISETADTLTLADNQGKKHELRKADIEESQAHAGSIMPDGLEKPLSLDEFVDLIAYLTSEKQTAGR
jgi:putative membrane-bound dehydrogenase-like protein